MKPATLEEAVALTQNSPHDLPTRNYFDYTDCTSKPQKETMKKNDLEDLILRLPPNTMLGSCSKGSQKRKPAQPTSNWSLNYPENTSKTHSALKQFQGFFFSKYLAKILPRINCCKWYSITGSRTRPKIAELGNNTLPIATPCTKDLVDPQKSAAI